MKSPFAKHQNADDTLESALRNSAPLNEPPGALHDSIMQNVRAFSRTKKTAPSGFERLHRLLVIRWLPATGFAALIAFGIWLAFQTRTQPPTRSLPQFSAAFAASQEAVDSLPTVAVGPLSDELDNLSHDLTRTADFLLATLP